MRSLLSRVLLVAGVVVALIVARPMSVDAQPAPGTLAPTPAAKEEAKQLVAAGIKAQDEKNYGKAIELYQKAYALVPHPILLFNIAQAQRLAGRLDEAVRYYQRYLAIAPNGTEAAAARAIVANLSTASRPLEAAPGPDARKPAEDPKAGDGGPTSPAPAEPPAATPGEPPPAAPQVAAAPAPEAPEPSGPSVSMQRDTPARPGRTLRIAGIVVGGLGVASAGAALAFGLRLESLEKDQLARFNQGLPYEPDKVRKGEAAERNQYIAAALAGTFVVGGVVMYLVGRRQGRAASTAWMPMVGPDVAGIAITGLLP